MYRHDTSLSVVAQVCKPAHDGVRHEACCENEASLGYIKDLPEFHQSTMW